MARAGSVVPLSELIARVDALASGGSAGGDATPSNGGGSAPPSGTGRRRTSSNLPPETPPATMAHPKDPAAATVAADSKEQEILRRVTAKRGALGSYLEHACAFRIDGKRLVVRFPARHALFKNGLARADNRQILVEAVREATGHDLEIDVGISQNGDPDLKTLTEADRKLERREALMSQAMEEPIVRAFMDRFRARVVRVEEIKPS